MLINYSSQPICISIESLKKFIQSCHWDYLKKYDVVGHHGAGWGLAYIPNNSNNLVIRRTLEPIYNCKWQDLANIKTRFLLIHARKTIFGEKRLENVHPICLGDRFCIVHNGTIKMKSFPPLNRLYLQKIKENTDLDTRRYLCTLLDNIINQNNIKDAIETTLKKIHVNSAANAFLFNSKECYIIKYQKNTFNGRHTTLFIQKGANRVMISTTPLNSKALEIPNASFLSISSLKEKKLKIRIDKLYI
ncbi:MAG: class II glutamine amidotransferase [Promethearchaeati archaeon]